MRDTAPVAAALARERWLDLPPEHRLLLAASMFDSARAMVFASIPDDLTPASRRSWLCARLYGGDLARRLEA